jgi:disulfide oxidoreductase YuzD
LQQEFGDRVKVEYYDLSDPSLQTKHADVVDAIEKHDIAYPLTAINGVFKFAGGVSYYAILNTVQALIGEPAGAALETQEVQA